MYIINLKTILNHSLFFYKCIVIGLDNTIADIDVSDDDECPESLIISFINALSLGWMIRLQIWMCPMMKFGSHNVLSSKAYRKCDTYQGCNSCTLESVPPKE